MENEKLEFIEALTTGIGSLAEMSVLFYDACVKSGASQDIAITLTQTFLSALTEGLRKGGTNDVS